MKKGITLFFCIIALAAVFSPSCYADVTQWENLFQKAVMQAEQKQFNPAFETGKEALSLAEKSFGKSDNKTINTIFFVAEMAKKSGNPKEAEIYYNKAIEAGRNSNPPNPAVEAVALNNLAEMANNSGNYQDAEKYLLQLIPIMESGLGIKDAKIGILKGNLGAVYKSMKRYDQAEKCYLESIEIFKFETDKNEANIANAYGHLAAIYEAMDQYGKALILYNKAREEYTILDGADSTAAKRLSVSQAGVLQTMGIFSEAETLLKKVIDAYTSPEAKPDLQLSSALNSIAKLYLKMKKLDLAETNMKRALDINLQIFGKDHKETALVMNDLALIYQNEAKYDLAEKLLLQSMEIYRKKSGENSLQVSAVYNNLGTLYQEQGKYEDAEKCLKKSLEIGLKNADPQSLLIAGKLNNLAEFYRVMGRYADAEPLYLKAASIYEKVLGSTHSDYANILNNLASFYHEAGKLRQANDYYEKSLSIIENNPNSQPFDKAKILNNYAQFSLARGKFKEAFEGFEKALVITESVLGKEHPDLASPLNNLAVIYFNFNRTDKAIRLMQRAMELAEKSYGTDSPVVATYASNLALFLINKKQYGEAAKLLEKSLNIRLKALGKEHTVVAVNYSALGGLNLEQKKYKEAEDYFRKAIQIDEKIFGSDSFNLSNGLGNLALALTGSNHIPEACACVKKAMEIDNKTIEQIFAISSEQEKFNFLSTVNTNYNRFLILATGYMSKDKSILTEALNAVLRRKGIVLDAMASERRMTTMLNDETSRSFYNRLREVTSLIASLTLAGPGNLSPEAYSKKLAELETLRQNIEKELASKSSSYKTELQSRNVTSGEISQILPKGSVLVEFAAVHGTDLTNTGSIGNSQYYAFILESTKNNDKGLSSPPRLIALGDTEVIDEAVGDFRKEMEKTRWLLESGILDEAEAEKKLAEKGRRIYDLIISPVKEAAGPNTTLFIAPDGALNLIPFGCIRDNQGKYLIETYNINYLSSGRDLIRFKTPAKNSGENIIAANPDYNMAKPGNDENSSTNRAGQKISGSVESTLRNWSPLSGTDTEAKNIVKLLPKGETKEYTGNQALEETIKNTGAPNILHIATHGFFLEDQLSLMSDNTNRGVSMAGEKKTQVSNIRIENPLLRCGLIFAGANTAGTNPASQDDGILTALEISGLNLEGTNLVVLSACDTGLGETRQGEGVFGLRRAFQLAGARTIIMSLWSVPDQQTQELMTGFYTSFTKGKGKSGSLREAQLVMIKERRAKSGAAHPYFWGAFISAGEP